MTWLKAEVKMVKFEGEVQKLSETVAHCFVPRVLQLGLGGSLQLFYDSAASSPEWTYYLDESYTVSSDPSLDIVRVHSERTGMRLSFVAPAAQFATWVDALEEACMPSSRGSSVHGVSDKQRPALLTPRSTSSATAAAAVKAPAPSVAGAPAKAVVTCAKLEAARATTGPSAKVHYVRVRAAEAEDGIRIQESLNLECSSGINCLNEYAGITDLIQAGLLEREFENATRQPTSRIVHAHIKDRGAQRPRKLGRRRTIGISEDIVQVLDQGSRAVRQFDTTELRASNGARIFYERAKSVTGLHDTRTSFDYLQYNFVGVLRLLLLNQELACK
ncbi:hypothetical protein FVE85_2800 [Porphyridium purpureum]|uniref:Uncharacterized protein n=1 Tax=Porphyridium purpureum TaxID=35688 RepID=A0A5J4YSX6_PORPP|nr:hypothetical protein FVE85_2800 [Porphyridium purpureum]|eukprot:POR6898..scf227_4